jgi:hypothetical protein
VVRGERGSRLRRISRGLPGVKQGREPGVFESFEIGDSSNQWGEEIKRRLASVPVTLRGKRGEIWESFTSQFVCRYVCRDAVRGVGEGGEGVEPSANAGVFRGEKRRGRDIHVCDEGGNVTIYFKKRGNWFGRPFCLNELFNAKPRFVGRVNSSFIFNNPGEPATLHLLVINY